MSNTLFNVSSMIYQNKLRSHENALARSLERMSTGKSVNHAKDDPFRNYEAKNIENDITCGAKAKQNSVDGVAMLQIAEGACNEMQNILQRVRELAIQGANDTLTSTERYYLNMEAGQLLNEFDRIAASAIYNEKQIFGGFGADSFSSSERILENGKQVNVGILHVGTGADPKKVNDTNEIRVKIPELSTKELGLKTIRKDAFGKPEKDSVTGDFLYDEIKLEELKIEDHASSVSAIDVLDSAINSVSTVRSYMGSLVSRLDREIEDMESRDINLNDYLGKISDTDIAKESTAFAAAQIKQQAATSVLAQSNARIGKILEMLG